MYLTYTIYVLYIYICIYIYVYMYIYCYLKMNLKQNGHKSIHWKAKLKVKGVQVHENMLGKYFLFIKSIEFSDSYLYFINDMKAI